MNFRSTTRYFFIIVGILIFFHELADLSLWWLCLPLLAYKAMIIYGSANIQSNFFVKALCGSVTLSKKISITFDDGPSTNNTKKVLSVLAEYNAPATFFLIGKNIKNNEDIVKEIDDAGHILGNHTYSHSFFIDFKNASSFKNELSLTNDLVYEITKKRMKLFRPPYGVTTPGLAKACKHLKLDIIGWNIRSLDTTNDTIETITSRVTSRIKPGSIILFHDTSEKTVEVLKQTLKFAKQNGFKIIGIEQLLKVQAYE